MTNLVSLFAAVAARQPAKVAVRCGERSTTYGELARRVAATRDVLTRHGVRAGDAVPVCGPPSVELVEAILAAMAAGAYYLPIDVETPRARVAELLDGHDMPVGLAWREGQDTLDRFPSTLVLPGGARPSDREDLSCDAAGPGDLAYAIFTSGSTGTPKGVAVTHQAVTSLLRDTRALFDIGPDDVWSLFHSPAFDFSVWEIWGALAFGGTLVVVPRATQRDPRAFADLVRGEGVTVLNQTPCALQSLIAHASLGDGSLRHAIVGGDAVRPALVEAWRTAGPRSARLTNMYGITEVTVHATHHTISNDGDWPALGVIGRALPGTTIELVDEELQVVAAGEPGEIVVSGERLAVGYLHDPERTARQFLDVGRMPGAMAADRWYRSGDIACRRADGTLEFLGRRDSQVKVRGYRVELAEAERALMRSGMLEAAHVDVDADVGAGAAQRLRAFVVPKASQPFDVTALRDVVRRSLPPYAVPGRIILVEALPLTSNGKLDVARLGSYESREDGDETTATDAGTEDVGPSPAGLDRVALADVIARAWTTVLDVDAVGLGDDFFELGGHSLVAAEMSMQIEEELKIEVPLGLVFEHSTVAELADALIEHVRSAS